MLYVSTRNTVDTYTAYRALHEVNAPDGGGYVPFYLPAFSDEEMSVFKTQSCGDTIAQILNLFFGLHLNGWDVECVIGRSPFKLEIIQHKLLIAEAWRNPEASLQYLLKSLYTLMTDHKSQGKQPVGWSCIAIEIALLFGLYSTMEDMPQGFDIAVTVGDFSGLTAVCYARDMGLPVNVTVCTCNEDSAVWDLVNRGEFSTNTAAARKAGPNYLECFLYECFGAGEIQRYLTASGRKVNYCIDEIQQKAISNKIFAAVVSTNRIDDVVANVYRTNRYCFDQDSAIAYGGLQDYRSSSGISHDTLILAKKRPIRIKE